MATRRKPGEYIGLLVGLATGLGAAVVISNDSEGLLGGLDQAMVAIGLGASLGFGLGGYVGNTIKYEHWSLVWARTFDN